MEDVVTRIIPCCVPIVWSVAEKASASTCLWIPASKAVTKKSCERTVSSWWCKPLFSLFCLASVQYHYNVCIWLEPGQTTFLVLQVTFQSCHVAGSKKLISPEVHSAMGRWSFLRVSWGNGLNVSEALLWDRVEPAASSSACLTGFSYGPAWVSGMWYSPGTGTCCGNLKQCMAKEWQVPCCGRKTSSVPSVTLWWFARQRKTWPLQ